MEYDPDTRENRADAASNLEMILPAARAYMHELEGRSFEEMGIPDLTASALSEQRLAGIHIYQDAKRGWHAVIKLEGMPEGATDAYGNVEETPLVSRIAAEELAARMLAVLLAALHKRSSEVDPRMEIDEPAPPMGFRH